MSQVDDLVFIGQQIGAINSQQVASRSDIELLKSIVSRLKVLQEQPRKSDNNKLEVLLQPNRLPDSLAFPSSHCDKKQLAKATELWTGLRTFNDLLKQDHTYRRQMLLNRLDCTVESFKWKSSIRQESGDHGKSLNDIIHEKYDVERKKLREEPRVSMSHLLAIRETESDALLNYIVSTKKTGQKQNNPKLVNLKRIIIPDVPDRGGRPDEIRAPPKESFYHQNKSRSRGGGGRR